MLCVVDSESIPSKYVAAADIPDADDASLHHVATAMIKHNR